MKTLMPGGEPFFYPGDSDVGCLLTHGFTGAPEEMRWMGEYLAKQGITSLGVRLFGHATQPADMNRARSRDWLASVEDGYHLLRNQVSKMIVVGLSTGGALSILMARDFPVAGVVVMSTPPWFPQELVRKLRPVIPLVSKFWRFASEDGESDWHDKEAEKIQVHYPVFPVRATAELNDLLDEMRGTLDQVTVPALLIYARGDGTIPPESGQVMYDGLGSADKELMWLTESGHNIPRDASRQQAFEAAASFIRRVAA
ncbi:MAG: alpha/beta hydrolase [Anaerolineales bacterium]